MDLSAKKKERTIENKNGSEEENSIRPTVKILMGLLGFYLDNRLKFLENKIASAVTAFYILTFVCQVKKFQTSETLLAIFDDAFCICGFINCLAYYWAIRMKGDCFKRIAKLVIGDNGNFESAEYFQGVNFLLKKYILSYSIPYFIAVATFTLFPMMVPIITDTKPGQPATMIYPSWYPWSINSTYSYIFTMTFIQIPSITVASITYTATVGFISCVMISLTQHFENLRNSIQNLQHDTIRRIHFQENQIGDLSAKGREIHYDRMVYLQIMAMIRYHQFLIKYIRDVMTYCKLITTLTLITFFSVMVMIPFLVTTIEGNYLYRMKMISAATVIIIIFFIYCYIAEMMNDLNESLANVIYNTSWYRQPINTRKIVLIFLTQVQYHYKLKIFGMYEVNRNFYTRVMKLNFSVLNVVLMMYRRK